ncbi:TIGR03905 family TSCPD domain-containing protein [bacterium]|nr:TIGR03905 family TSCPD domain-containing protein [bacterium]
MKHYEYKTHGTCSQRIIFDVDDDNKIHNTTFIGGCNGNLKAISKLVEGKDKDEIITILKGNTCGPRPTSCADQFAKALEEVK